MKSLLVWQRSFHDFLFSTLFPKQAAANISRVAVWRIACLQFSPLLLLLSFILIPQLYRHTVSSFVPSGGAGSSLYNILLSACWIRDCLGLCIYSLRCLCGLCSNVLSANLKWPSCSQAHDGHIQPGSVSPCDYLAYSGGWIDSWAG